MSTHYLLSLFNDDINDIVTPPAFPGESEITGNYVVRVPDDVVVREPVSVADLLTQKYASILASHGLFTQIVHDDMLDATGINMGTSTNIITGIKGTNGLLDGGLLETTVESLTWGGPGAGPPQAILTYEVFQYADTDSASGVYSRSYEEVDPLVAPITVQISFDGGATFQAVTDKNLINIVGPSQGTNLILRFTHTATPTGRYFLGSWAVVF